MILKLIAKIFLHTMTAAAILAGISTANAEETRRWSLDRDDYTLQQVVILSRHNIRSPLSGKGSVLDDITPHEWFPWSSSPSELSLRGGVLETEMGQFFRKWLESVGLIPENYRPEGNEVRFYSNSKQRTIATAHYFAAGFLSAANTDVEFHMEFDKMDPVFTPQLTFCSDAYAEYAEAEIRALFTDKINDLADNYALLTEVLDMEDSEGRKNGSISEFRTDDTQIIIQQDSEPAMSGSLKTACSAADSLVLQYYEELDALKAAFGHRLSEEQWKDISEIKDVYEDVLFSSPLIAQNAAHPMLQEIRAEMDTEGRIFTFLCGHDSNVVSVLAALGAEEYTLPEAIEAKTPIGCKLVFSKWTDKEGDIFWGLDLVYQTPEQLRNMPLLTQENPPSVFPIKLRGLDCNQDGLYSAGDLPDRLDQAIEAYDLIIDNYSENVFTEEYDLAVAE